MRLFALFYHDDVIKLKHFPRYLPFVRGIHRSRCPSQRPVTRSFDIIFGLHLNKLLSKQSWGWWFETRSGSLWRHCNEYSLSWALSAPPKTMPAESVFPFLVLLNTFPNLWLKGPVKCTLLLSPIPSQHAVLFVPLPVQNIHNNNK